MTKENIRRNIMKEALTEKVNDLLFELSTNWIEFNTESEAFDFITVVRELIKEYDLPKSLLNKVCLFSSAKRCEYLLCMETNKKIVEINSTFFGKDLELIATW